MHALSIADLHEFMHALPYSVSIADLGDKDELDGLPQINSGITDSAIDSLKTLASCWTVDSAGWPPDPSERSPPPVEPPQPQRPPEPQGVNEEAELADWRCEPPPR